MKVYVYQCTIEPRSTDECPMFVTNEELSKEKLKELAKKHISEDTEIDENTFDEEWNDGLYGVYCCGCFPVVESEEAKEDVS